MTVSDLPLVNASLNGLAALLLLAGFICIRTGRREAHRRFMIAAFVTSAVFLVTYVLHKILVRGVHTRFQGEGTAAILYYCVLFSHLVLAMAVVPLALMTMARAWRGDFAAHRRIARWTWPVWMYVSVTGVLVYLFLYVWYPSRPASTGAAPPAAVAK